MSILTTSIVLRVHTVRTINPPCLLVLVPLAVVGGVHGRYRLHHYFVLVVFVCLVREISLFQFFNHASIVELTSPPR